MSNRDLTTPLVLIVASSAVLFGMALLENKLRKDVELANRNLLLAKVELYFTYKKYLALPCIREKWILLM